MTKKNPAAVALGSLGGKVTSAKKAAAARANGQKGGRPAKKAGNVNLGPVLRSFCFVVALLSYACGGKGSPTGPSTVTPSPTTVTPSQITLSGRVTATNGGQPLPGLSVDLGGVQSVTDGSGGFTSQVLPSGSVRLLLTGAGIVPRSLLIASGATRDVAVNAFGAGFDLAYFRQIARDDADAPGSLQPLRHLPAAPSVYLKTVDEAGVAIDAVTLRTTATALASLGGALRVATVQQGTETREGVAGWVTVRWPAARVAGICGQSTVGRDGGVIDLNYLSPTCGCNGSKIRPTYVRHELGHAFGLYHTDTPTDLMSGAATMECDRPLSAREAQYAGFLYARPVGNLDPDIDPVSAVTLAAMTVR